MGPNKSLLALPLRKENNIEIRSGECQATKLRAGVDHVERCYPTCTGGVHTYAHIPTTNISGFRRQFCLRPKAAKNVPIYAHNITASNCLLPGSLVARRKTSRQQKSTGAKHTPRRESLGNSQLHRREERKRSQGGFGHQAPLPEHPAKDGKVVLLVELRSWPGLLLSVERVVPYHHLCRGWL